MRELHVNEIIPVIEKMCIEACNILPSDVMDAIKKAYDIEESPIGKNILNLLVENALVAAKEEVPICQDTGIVLVFVELGQDLHIVGGNLYDAINEGVRRGYINGYLRKSIVDDPIFERKNTKDNTPAVIYTDIVPGDKLKIAVMPKGGGSENMSQVRMLIPADGPQGIKKVVLEAVEKAGPNPCPPILVGVGVGGTMDKAAVLSKKALLRKVGEFHPNPKVAALEREILEEVNKLGIGPQGLGGRVTALAVNIEMYPTHLVALPVAVSIQCHVARHVEVVL
ncbi:MAG: fumarate hydratase [Synergistetes bacterium]|nr:fumarate hydratase [Synergistota bacterium]MDW8192401.1 fumarate hydratase [Synergistota bacterium]